MSTTPQEVVARDRAPATTPDAPTAPRKVYRPRVDITETADAFVVAADLPGVPMEAIEVTVGNGRLELYASRTQAPHEGYEVAYRQHDAGEYRRVFTLPDDIDRDQVRADLRNGVLTISLPRTHAAEPRKIEVHANAATPAAG